MEIPMTDPVSGFIALLFGFVLGDQAESTSSQKPQPNPVLNSIAAPDCTLDVIHKHGRQSFVARISASNAGLTGRYELRLDGRGSNKISIHEKRSLDLKKGETAVLSRLDLDVGVTLSGRIVLTNSTGTILCQDTL
jgi:hypothetical protein